MNWDCDPWRAYVTGGIWMGLLGFLLGWALGRWNRRGGKIELTRSFDSPTVGE